MCVYISVFSRIRVYVFVCVKYTHMIETIYIYISALCILNYEGLINVLQFIKIKCMHYIQIQNQK